MIRKIMFLILLVLPMLSLLSLPKVNGQFEVKTYYLNLTIGGSIKNIGSEAYPINKTDLLYFDYPLNTSDQEVLGVRAVVNGTRYNYTLRYSESSITLIVNAPEYEKKMLKPGQWVSAWVYYNVSVDMVKRVNQVIDLYKAGSIEEIYEKAGSWNDLRFKEPKYLNETPLWNQSHPLVNLLYKYLTRKQGSMDKPFTALMTFIEWLDKNIVYSTRIPARHPWEVIVEGAGDCDDQSNLLITLLRKAGIPSFLEVGFVYLGKGYEFKHSEVGGLFHYQFIGGGGHGWLVAYIPPWGWLRIDLTASLGKGINHIKNAAYYITPIVVTTRVYRGDYATQSARFTENIRKTKLEYNITLIMREYNP